MDERRLHSMETVLVTLGELKAHSDDIKKTVSSLNERVGIQNGRVGKMEKWQSYIQGGMTIIILLVLPIVINFVSSWLKFTFNI